MQRRIGVFAEAPVPGQCRAGLLAAHDPAWAAGLYAAMLRDTLDGLLSIDASAYWVFAPNDEAGLALQRHVPAPWEIVTDVGDASSALRRLGESNGLALLARADAPAAPIDPILELVDAADDTPFALIGPGERGAAWLLGAKGLAASITDALPWGEPELTNTMRVRCTNTGVRLRELPPVTIVEEPSDVLALFEELRRHPERAPRTAQFVVTQG